MKKTLLLFTFALCANLASTQDLLSDIMAVETVTIVDSEDTKEAAEKFSKTFEEQKGKVEKLLNKHTEKFQGEVKTLIAKYNKVLAKGIEQDVSNEKNKVATKVNALSMSLLKDKKGVLVDYNNFMSQEIRKLPKTLKSDSENQVGEVVETYTESFKAELEANKQVIKAFKSTQHLTRDTSAAN